MLYTNYTFIHLFPVPILIGSLILGLLLFGGWRKKRGPVYLICLILFGFYILLVLNFVFFPIIIPPGWPRNITLQNTLTYIHRINLIPLRYTRTFYIGRYIIFVEIIGNILLTMPLGFLLPFLVRIPPRRIFWIGLATGLAFEGTQFLSQILGVIARNPHKVDINDVITNTTGVLLGYWLYRLVCQHWGRIKTELLGSPSTTKRTYE